MNVKRTLITAALAALALTLTAGPSLAYTVDLCAGQFTKIVAGQPIPMWGYDLYNDGVCTPTVPGPEIRVPVGDPDPTLTINLTNTLTVPTSLVIPGQAMPDGSAPVFFTDPNGNERVRSFTTEAPADGGTATYTWSNFKPGTYAYHSGTQPSLQPPMGLYGAAIKDAAAGQAYPGVAYANEVVLFYSEIASDLHGPPPTPARPLNYHPDYYLINGEPYMEGVTTPIDAGNAGQTTLVRMINMGIEQRLPVFLGLYVDVIAEDGYPYPFPRREHTVALPPVKTRDALVTPNANGTHAVYDAAMGLSNGGASPGGMLAFLQFGGATAGDVVANPDSYATEEDLPIVATAGDATTPGVLDNDTGTTPLTASIVSNPTNGTLVMQTDGSFSYEPNPNYNGSDTFTYRASNASGTSEATVDISVTAVNDAPTAVNDAYEATEGVTLSVDAAAGVLANDSDVDGDNLSVTTTPVSGPTGGSLTLNADGSFDYTPTTAVAGDSDSFTYQVCDDGVPAACSNAEVTISVVPIAGNQPPVANPDFAQMNQVRVSVDQCLVDPTLRLTINVTGNDTDVDGTIDTGSVVITEAPNRGGAAVFVGSGNVWYCPKRNFRGQETFSYTVNDNDGATSNQTDVNINVLR